MKQMALLVLAALLGGAVLAGCGDGFPGAWPGWQSGDGDPEPSAPPTRARSGDGETGTVRVTPPKTRSAGADEPRETYSVWMTKTYGPDQAALAKVAVKKVRTELGLGDTFALPDTEKDAMVVYTGAFARRDQAETLAARIRAWNDPQGRRPYPAAHVAANPRENPGRPEWNLLNTPKQAVYSVAVEEYFNEPAQEFQSRKHVAAARCAELRAQGKPAYYYHGPAKSYVSLGLFPAKAVQPVREGVVTRPKIVDPELQAMIRSNPRMYVNGLQVEVSVAEMGAEKARMLPRPSIVFRIPGRDVEETVDAPIRFGDSQLR